MSNTLALILTIFILTIIPWGIGRLLFLNKKESFTDAECWGTGMLIETALFFIGAIIWGIFELLKLM